MLFVSGAGAIDWGDDSASTTYALHTNVGASNQFDMQFEAFRFDTVLRFAIVDIGFRLGTHFPISFVT